MNSLALLMVAAAAAGSSFSGVGRAIDGDSLMVGDQEVRLFGIDAPEAKQTCSRNGQSWSCGLAAADQLSQLVSGQQVNCAKVGSDRYGRALGQCSVGGTDINRYMVATGFALAYRRYSLTYASAEETAKAFRRGIWSSQFEMPDQYRRDGGYIFNEPDGDQPGHSDHAVRVVRGARSKPQPTGSCRIKGNHSRRGELIYHLPGMPYYVQTAAEEVFCSEAEARAAGYRRSRADQHR